MSPKMKQELELARRRLDNSFANLVCKVNDELSRAEMLEIEIPNPLIRNRFIAQMKNLGYATENPDQRIGLLCDGSSYLTPSKKVKVKKVARNLQM